MCPRARARQRKLASREEAYFARLDAWLARARTELEPRTDDEERGVRTRARSTLHHLLRLEAEVLARQADSSGALSRLEQARDLAPTLEALRDTLLEEARLLAGKSHSAGDIGRQAPRSLAVGDHLRITRPKQPLDMMHRIPSPAVVSVSAACDQP